MFQCLGKMNFTNMAVWSCMHCFKKKKKKKGSFSLFLFQKQKWNLFKLEADVWKGEKKKVKAIITMVSLRVYSLMIDNRFFIFT